MDRSHLRMKTMIPAVNRIIKKVNELQRHDVPKLCACLVLFLGIDSIQWRNQTRTHVRVHMYTVEIIDYKRN